MKVYKNRNAYKTTISRNTATKGESMEEKIQRIIENKEPIKDAVPMIYQERKDGVQEAYNPRADRWDIAIGATDKATKSEIAKRTADMKVVKNDENPEGDSIETTGENTK